MVLAQPTMNWLHHDLNSNSEPEGLYPPTVAMQRRFAGVPRSANYRSTVDSALAKKRTLRLRLHATASVHVDLEETFGHGRSDAVELRLKIVHELMQSVADHVSRTCVVELGVQLCHQLFGGITE